MIVYFKFQGLNFVRLLQVILVLENALPCSMIEGGRGAGAVVIMLCWGVHWCKDTQNPSDYPYPNHVCWHSHFPFPVFLFLLFLLERNGIKVHPSCPTNIMKGRNVITVKVSKFTTEKIDVIQDLSKALWKLMKKWINIRIKIAEEIFMGENSLKFDQKNE